MISAISKQAFRFFLLCEVIPIQNFTLLFRLGRTIISAKIAKICQRYQCKKGTGGRKLNLCHRVNAQSKIVKS